MKPNFWENKSLDDLSEQEWESLCDGCGRCCLIKLEDDETEELFYTDIACRLLDTRQCRCIDYAHRVQKAPGCVVLRPYNKELYDQLPTSCAYRRLSQGLALEVWHPLLSHSTDTIHSSNISVRDKVISEDNVHEDEWQDHIIEF
ncbi:MAG: YcgN family cysteine cluster protein [Gammaproteobacteria bacterium]